MVVLAFELEPGQERNEHLLNIQREPSTVLSTLHTVVSFNPHFNPERCRKKKEKKTKITQQTVAGQASPHSFVLPEALFFIHTAPLKGECAYICVRIYVFVLTH